MNLNKVGDLDKLTESERYWLGYCNRHAEKQGWTTKIHVPEGRARFLQTKEGMKRPEYIQVYLYDSLMVGLHTQRSMLALRCYAQVMRYLGMLEIMNDEGMLPDCTAFPVDAITTLRSKVENLMGRVN